MQLDQEAAPPAFALDVSSRGSGLLSLALKRTFLALSLPKGKLMDKREIKAK